MAEAESAAGKTVLVADDELSMRAILERRLTAWGYAVITADDGIKTIEAVKARMPDLILLDIMMPGLDGFEVCRRLKADEKTRGIPIIVITAKAGKSLSSDVTAAGADAYLQKPFDRSELQSLIKDRLGTPI